MKQVLIIVLLAVLTGCAGGAFDLRKTAETSIHLKLLDAEFERAVDAVQSQPLNEAERAPIDLTIAELQVERQFLRTLHKQSAGRIALTGIQAQTHLDDITAAYMAGRAAYAAFLTRTRQPLSPLLKSFDESAGIAHQNIQEAINSGAGVSGAEMAQYLTLALRTIAAVNGVPL